MTTNYEMLLLGDLVDKVRDKAGFENKVNIKPLAEELGIDIDKAMEEIIEICNTRDYNVGTHMYCTRENVIPRYHKNPQKVS
jgi:hypothetical protein